MLARVVHRLVKEKSFNSFEGFKILGGDTIFVGFVRLEVKYNPINILMLYKKSNSHFQSHLLNRWQIVAATHNATLDELFSGHFLEGRQSFVFFEFLVALEIVPSEHLPITVEVQLRQQPWTSVGDQVTVLTDCEISYSFPHHV